MTQAISLTSNAIYNFFSIFEILFEFHNFNLKLCSKHYNKINLLHLNVVPKLLGGW